MTGICYFNSKFYLYKAATKYYEQRNYAKADKFFSRISNYKNSEEMLTEVRYDYAIEYYEQENFKEAEEMLSGIAGYKNSEEMLAEIWYAFAVDCMDEEEYDKALEYIKKYENLATEKNVEEEELSLHKEQIAEAYRSRKEYEKAIELYRELNETYGAWKL